jgi:hypothetical protein
VAPGLRAAFSARLAAEKDTKTPILALKKNMRRCVLTPLSAGLAQMGSAFCLYDLAQLVAVISY